MTTRRNTAITLHEIPTIRDSSELEAAVQSYIADQDDVCFSFVSKSDRSRTLVNLAAVEA